MILAWLCRFKWTDFRNLEIHADLKYFFKKTFFSKINQMWIVCFIVIQALLGIT